MGRIVLENVTVDYPVFGAGQSFRKSLFNGAVGGLIRKAEQGRSVFVRSVDGISMTVNEGDRIGLIGANGAGKSTLLRVLAGIYPPTSGSIRIDGRVSALFNTTLGMDMDDTGLENIKHVGRCLGMARDEIEEKTRQIIDFAEIGDFIGLPVRTYSAGMQLRLAFSIATSIDPGILLLDEGLGAGDASFAEKANKRVAELVDKSSALVLASHAEALIRDMCNKAVLMEHGKVIVAGDMDLVIEKYGERVRKAART